MNHAIALIVILTVEYIADFLLQDRETATKKSEQVDYLRDHVLVIIGAVFIPSAVIFSIAWGGLHGILGGAFFAVLNGIAHAITDWNIWKGYKLIVYKRFEKEWDSGNRRKYVNAACKSDYLHNGPSRFVDNKEYAEDSWFYNTIGLDRLIHVSTIIFLYFWFI